MAARRAGARARREWGHRPRLNRPCRAMSDPNALIPPPLTPAPDLDAALGVHRLRRARRGRQRWRRRALARPSHCRRSTPGCRTGAHLPPDAYLLDGGKYRQRRHGVFIVDGEHRDWPRRIARTGSPSTTTRCTAASSAISSPSSPAWPPTPPGSGFLVALAARASALEGRAALVRRGAYVPHRHRQRHRPPDARGRTSRRRRPRQRDAGGAPRDQGRRDAACSRRQASAGLRFTMSRAVDDGAARRRPRDPRDDADPAAARPASRAGATRWC